MGALRRTEKIVRLCDGGESSPGLNQDYAEIHPKHVHLLNPDRQNIMPTWPGSGKNDPYADILHTKEDRHARPFQTASKGPACVTSTINASYTSHHYTLPSSRAHLTNLQTNLK